MITRWPRLECCYLSSLRQSGHKYHTTLQLYKCTYFCSILHICTSVRFGITQVYNIQLYKEPNLISQAIPCQSQIDPCAILTLGRMGLGKIGSQWADRQGKSRSRITTPPPQQRNFSQMLHLKRYNITIQSIILEGPSVSVMTIVQCLSVSVTAAKGRQWGGLGTPGHLTPTTWTPLKPVTSGGPPV